MKTYPAGENTAIGDALFSCRLVSGVALLLFSGVPTEVTLERLDSTSMTIKL